MIDGLIDIILTADMWIVVMSAFLAFILTLDFDSAMEENKERNERK